MGYAKREGRVVASHVREAENPTGTYRELRNKEDTFVKDLRLLNATFVGHLVQSRRGP